MRIYMSFYSATPVIPANVIGSSVFNRVSIDVNNGKKFVVKAEK